jgi:hypothetical protein
MKVKINVNGQGRNEYQKQKNIVWGSEAATSV